MNSMSKSSSEEGNIDKDYDYHQDKHKHRDHSYQDRMIQKERDYYNKHQDMRPQMHSDPRMKTMDEYGYEQDRARTAPYDSMQSRMSHQSNIGASGGNQTGQPLFLHNPLVNSGQSMKMKSMQMVNPDQHSIGQMSNLDLHQNAPHNQESYLMGDMLQNTAMNDMMSMPGGDGNPGMSHLDQYILPRNSSPSVDVSVMNSNPSYMSNAGAMQSLQMSNAVNPSDSNMGGRVSSQYSSMPANSSSIPGWGVATTGMYSNSAPSQMESLVDLCSSFRNILPIPKNATNTVYVEGIPPDAKEREVARKSCLFCLAL